jgi:hypothetical protein
MDNIQQWILFGLGVISLILGIGLMAYGALQKRATAGEGQEDRYAQILKALATLVKALGDYFGANLASKIGFMLAVFGFILIFGPFYVPGFIS